MRNKEYEVRPKLIINILKYITLLGLLLAFILWFLILLFAMTNYRNFYTFSLITILLMPVCVILVAGWPYMIIYGPSIFFKKKIIIINERKNSHKIYYSDIKSVKINSEKSILLIQTNQNGNVKINLNKYTFPKRNNRSLIQELSHFFENKKIEIGMIRSLENR